MLAARCSFVPKKRRSLPPGCRIVMSVRRQAQQGDQRWPCWTQIQGAPRRSRRLGTGGVARRLRQTHRRGNREVGQGGEVHRHQGRL